MFYFDRPRGRFLFAFEPRLGPHDAAAIGCNIHTRFQTIPLVRFPFERHGFAQALLVGIDFKLLRVALQNDGVTLIDQAHFGHLAAIAFRQNIRFDSVILHVTVTEVSRAALEQLVLNGFAQGFAAVLLAHFITQTGTDPRQGRIGELRRLFNRVCGCLAQIERFEVLLDRQIAQDTPANDRARISHRGHECAGGRHILRVCHEFATFIESALHRGFHQRCGRDVARPFHGLGIDIFVYGQTVRVERSDTELGFAAGLQQHFRRNGLQFCDRAGIRPRLFFDRRRQARIIPRLAEAIEFLVRLDVNLSVVTDG